MNIGIIIFGFAAILFSSVCIELYARIATSINSDWKRLILYILGIALIMGAPMMSIKYLVGSNESFTKENQHIPFSLWLVGIAIYVFVLRRKHILRSIGR